MQSFFSFSDLPEKELFPGIRARITHSENLTLSRVTLDAGVELPEHHHHNEQWTTILEGELEMEVNGENRIMTPGMSVHIASDVPHRAIARKTCVVLDVFVPKRDDL